MPRKDWTSLGEAGSKQDIWRLGHIHKMLYYKFQGFTTVQYAWVDFGTIRYHI